MHANTHTLTHIHAHTCTYMHAHARTCSHTHAHTLTHAYMHAHARTADVPICVFCPSVGGAMRRVNPACELVKAGRAAGPM